MLGPFSFVRNQARSPGYALPVGKVGARTAARVGALVVLLVGSPAFGALPEVRAGHVAPEGSPWDLAVRMVVDHLAPRVAPRRVKLFGGAVLGDEEAHLEKCRNGQLQICGISDFASAKVVPELGVFALPFLFRDDQEIEYAIDRLLLERLGPAFRRAGLHLLVLAGVGWLDIATRRPVRGGDLTGVRMRVPGNPVHSRLAQVLGARPVSASMQEVDTLLQAGLVDGLFHTQVFLFGSGWSKNLRHILEARLAFSCAMVVFNQAFWESLPESVRKDLTEHGKEVARATWREYRTVVPRVRRELIASGLTITGPSPEVQRQLEDKLGRAQMMTLIGPAASRLATEVEHLLEARRPAPRP